MSDQLSIALRPRKFSQVIGQDLTVRLLQQMVAKSYHPRCILLTGLCGTGKTTLARLYAALVNCTGRGDELEPCGTCYNCTSIFGSSSSIVVELEAASHRSVDDMDDVRRSVAYAVPEGCRRVIIVDEFHAISSTAQESLLHILEANAADTTFIITTTKPHAIEEAVLSRALPIALSPILPEERRVLVAQYFRDFGLNVDEATVNLVTQARYGLRSVWQLVDKLRLEFGEKPIDCAQAQEVLGLIAGERLESFIASTGRGKSLLSLLEKGQALQKSGCAWQDLLDVLFAFAEDSIVMTQGGEIRLTSGVSENFLMQGVWSQQACLAFMSVYFELSRLDWKTGLPRLYSLAHTPLAASPAQAPIVAAAAPKVATPVELLNADPVWALISKKIGKRVVEVA